MGNFVLHEHMPRAILTHMHIFHHFPWIMAKLLISCWRMSLWSDVWPLHATCRWACISRIGKNLKAGNNGVKFGAEARKCRCARVRER